MKLDYSFLSKVAEYGIRTAGFYIEDITYAEAVTRKIVTNLEQLIPYTDIVCQSDSK